MGRAVTPFHALTPFTLLDYPGRSACIAWVAGCNMRCGYCHNPQIVHGPGALPEEAVLAFLRRRQGLLGGVVLSGGEATSWPGLAGFAARAKAMGFAVKLDTNGLRPDVVASLLEGQLVDYVALDCKAPPARFREVTGVTTYRRFTRTLDLLCAQRVVDFEVRTTVHEALTTDEDVIGMACDLHARGYRGDYAIQPAVIDPDRPTLGALPAQRKRWDIDALQARSPLRLVLRRA